MSDFFGVGGYSRTPEGYMSWQHLLFVSCLIAIMTALAVILGLKYKRKPQKQKIKPLKVCAILINAIEISFVIFQCVKEKDPLLWRNYLPLFLCTVQLITLPIAAFAHGRLQEAALDFVFMFGILGAVLGTYGAGQNYACYPVLSINNVESGIVHCIAGFSSLYVVISGQASMRRKNVPITCAIVCGLCAIAYAADRIIPYNYMFLMRGDGTPYDILYDLLGGHPVFYPLGVVFLFLLYVFCFYLVFFAIRRKRAGNKS